MKNWLMALCVIIPSLAQAQTPGGILRVYHRDSPSSMSLHEEGTIGVVFPMMTVFSNLMLYDQHQKQNSPATIVPELATDWHWNEAGTDLTLNLRHGVRWHDGKPFTARDVACTFDLLTDKGKEKLRLNARGGWWTNVVNATADSDDQVTIHLKRKQPALLAMLAGGETPMYPCHVSPREMRQHPIGTGPFKFVEYKPNQSITVTRNTDYFKPGRPYLDGIEWTIVPNRSTAMLAFAADKFDMTFPNEITVPLLQELKHQAPDAICEIVPTSEVISVLANRMAPPFDNPEIRRAMALTIDRKAFVDILDQGAGNIGGTMQPPPEGFWGLPPDKMTDLPGYGPDVAANRAEARAIMQQLGYGPDKRLTVKMTVRNLPVYRDPGTLLLDQMREAYFDGELDLTETATWIPRLVKKEYTIAVSVLGNAVDDPDVVLYQNHVCGTSRNYTGHCNPALDQEIDRQSMEPDIDRRRQMVWEIDRTLQQELARPILYHRRAATCWNPRVKGLTLMVNSSYSGWRMEDVWLAR
jgi:peptide/nickel transport system substrate-binding protein